MFDKLRDLGRRKDEIEAAEVAWLKEVVAFDRSGAWRAEGYFTAAGALQAACRLDADDARRYIALARELR